VRVKDGEPKKKKRGRKPKSSTAVLDDFATPLATPPIMDVDIDLSFPDPALSWSSEDKGSYNDRTIFLTDLR
jgi:hypothetical protein